uniref:J domain-containing protein n=1 Tax=Panagrellus redivivus TaxID=6233 RepID=A0A7E4UNK9_PANRE
MVADANRDEALKCLQIAKDAMLEKDEAKMKRFIAKAQRLDPNCDVKSFLTGTASERSDKPPPQERSYSHDDHYEDADLRQRRRPSTGSNQKSQAKSNGRTPSASRSPKSSSRSRSNSASRASKPEYSQDEVHAVDRIRHCKDYYEILQVSKDSSEITLKKKYRELALKLHPDKCKVPGATDAFKALGNAYAVLSDTKKRAEYDQFGAEGVRGRRHNDGFNDYDVGRGFEAEMSPEDIFEMFFGGGFPNGSVYRRRAHFQFRREEPQEPQTLLGNIFHILPLLVLLFGGLFMQFLVGEPAYSLSREGDYVYPRITRDLRVNYYVKKNFESDYRSKLGQIESHVENEYITQLRMRCYKEKNNRESMLWTAKMRGDQGLWKKAQEMNMPSCKRLEEVMSH